mmetsp:Transcript_71546/g.225958  ORF Transcript_71546/g.225958 Transcript_71546/m.225958 type:complete len:277 (+) Transcript_71546:547-1377(+)
MAEAATSRRIEASAARRALEDLEEELAERAAGLEEDLEEAAQTEEEREAARLARETSAKLSRAARPLHQRQDRAQHPRRGAVRQRGRRAAAVQSLGGAGPRHPQPPLREPGAVAVRQPSHRRGRERERPRGATGVPQLHGHLVLPAAPSLPPRAPAAGRGAVQGLPAFANRVRDRRVSYRGGGEEPGVPLALLHQLPAARGDQHPRRRGDDQQRGVRRAHPPATPGGRAAVPGHLGVLRPVRRVAGAEPRTAGRALGHLGVVLLPPKNQICFPLES